MGMKQAFIKSIWDYRQPLPVQMTFFTLWSLVREALILSRGHRLRFLLANYIVVCLSLIPVIAPFVALHYPALVGAPWLPVVPVPLAAILTYVMPWLYFIFATIPFKLGLFLIATRIVYHRPYQLATTLFHYLRFFWIVNVLAVVVLIGFFLGVPIVFLVSKLVLDVFKDNSFMLNAILWALAVLAIAVSIYGSIWCSLLFIGRVNLLVGYKAAIKAVHRYFRLIVSVLLLECGCHVAALYSWHVSDLVLVPFSYLLWVLLYKQLFGDNAARV